MASNKFSSPLAEERDSDATAEQLRQVLGALTDGVLSLNRDWRITYLNRRAKEILAPSGDILGTKLWETYPQTIYEGSPYMEHYFRAMDEGIAGGFDAYYPEPLNAWFALSVQPTRDGIVLFFRDATEQKRAEEALRQTTEALAASEEELRWTVELSAQTPWTADDEGRILHFNQRWLELTGLTREQAQGEGWMQVPHAEDLPRMTKAWSHALRSGEPLDIEYRLRTAAGEYRWMRARAFPRHSELGRIMKWYGTTEDIHERKRAEEALIQSEKLAAVGRLATSIAHEINNPLESVTNLLYLALASEDLRANHAYLESAERELRRVSLIANQTLRFHKQSSKPQAIGCADLFTTVLSIYEGRLKNSNIKIETRKWAHEPVVCFEGDIRQVLNSLLGNAIDAMQPNGGRLLIRSRKATDWTTGRKGLMLTVADTGGGISPHVMTKIFEPFFTTKGIGGTGLGLWVSKGIVARHHGALRVRSSQRAGSSGTVFTLFLPFDAVLR